MNELNIQNDTEFENISLIKNEILSCYKDLFNELKIDIGKSVTITKKDEIYTLTIKESLFKIEHNFSMQEDYIEVLLYGRVENFIFGLHYDKKYFNTRAYPIVKSKIYELYKEDFDCFVSYINNSLEEVRNMEFTNPEINLSEINYFKRADEIYDSLSSLYYDILEYKEKFHFLK